MGAVVVACGLAACTTQEAKTDAGSGTGGKTGGTAGTTGGGTGGAGGSYPLVDGTLCPLPTQALITDFGYMRTNVSLSTTKTRFARFRCAI